jgi:hypothetical protein
MNTQEYFNKIAAHLLKQREKSTDKEHCRYRTVNDDGNRLSCAIGCMIPDDVYIPEMDRSGMPVQTLLHHYPELMSFLEPGQVEGLSGRSLNKRLQYMHDSLPVEDWKEGLRGIAREFGLEFNEGAL